MQDYAGNTTPEICPPEYAAYRMQHKAYLSRLKAGNPGGEPMQRLSHPAMDIWSLGCVLYQLVTRRHLLADLEQWDSEEFKACTADAALKVRVKVPGCIVDVCQMWKDLLCVSMHHTEIHHAAWCISSGEHADIAQGSR
jgi:hypothetical protein